jgi:hypothetical protein
VQRVVIHPSIQNVVGICKQITILILQQVSSWLVTLLKFIYASTEVKIVKLVKLLGIMNQIFKLALVSRDTRIQIHKTLVKTNISLWQ